MFELLPLSPAIRGLAVLVMSAVGNACLRRSTVPMAGSAGSWRVKTC
jgi:hypothetical protein